MGREDSEDEVNDFQYCGDNWEDYSDSSNFDEDAFALS